ncbi:hypothetical protein WJX84_001611 [Apatococcus fuscideae]|uniref:Uncharacterized protein n=1 Tax=Apatococcus fuscideae TaxID=2026836 RepID=A0AAW1TD78_9CHLO
MTCQSRVSQASLQGHRQAAFATKASRRPQEPVRQASTWQQSVAAATAAAALLLAPAAFAEGTPRRPTLGEERASYAEQLQNAIKERGQKLQELTDYPTTSEQKDLKDQPFQNQLGAGNSVKDAGAEFKLGDKAELPTAQQAADQLEKAVPEFFKPSDSPSPSPPLGSGNAAAAAQQAAAKLPSPPASLPNPAEAAKKVAANAPSPAANVPNPVASAKQAASKASAGSKSADPKEAAATNNAKVLIGGVAVLGLSLWYSIERKADPSLGGGGSSSPPPSKPSPPASSNGSAPDKEEDPFFQNVKERTK